MGTSSILAMARRSAAAFAVLAGFLALSVPAQANNYMLTRSPEKGVHVTGSDKAKLTLTEYVSYTCPHCAHFEAEAGDRLQMFYVGTGKIRMEVRHIVRDPFDLTVAMLANCGPDARFGGNHAMLMKTQPQWLGKLSHATTAQSNRYQTGTYTARRQAIAADAGLYKLMGGRGYDKATVDRCLADENMAKALSEKTMEYVKAGVSGTPSFAIDGVVLIGTHEWDTLRPQIDVRL